jgi:hypothetical protein
MAAALLVHRGSPGETIAVSMTGWIYRKHGRVVRRSSTRHVAHKMQNWQWLKAS